MLVAHLFEFDAKANIVSLERERGAGATINFVDKKLHLGGMLDARDHVVVELVGVHDVRLWQKVVVIHELVCLFGEHLGKQCKTCGDIDARIDGLILAEFDRPLWGARCPRKNAVLPSRISTGEWVTCGINAKPFGRVQNFVDFIGAHVD